MTKRTMLNRFKKVYSSFVEDGAVAFDGLIIDNYKDLRKKISTIVKQLHKDKLCADLSITDWDNIVHDYKK